jgi:acyl-ACP thioesterase
MDYRKFEKEYKVHVYEMGPNGLLNLYSLFDYLQDIASDHAVLLGFGRDDLMKNNSIWVLSRMYAEIKYLPRWEESIKVRTWPKGTDKLFALRDFEVMSDDGRHVASATSSWLVIDRSTKKIQRPDNLLTSFNNGTEIPDALMRNALKIDAALNGGKKSPEFHVRTSDLDINLHTNNVRYLKWVTDFYDLDFIMNKLPSSVEINYLSESVIGDKIFIRVSENQKDDTFDHSVIRMSDSKELCRIRIVWKDSKQEKVL